MRHTARTHTRNAMRNHTQVGAPTHNGIREHSEPYTHTRMARVATRARNTNNPCSTYAEHTTINATNNTVVRLLPALNVPKSDLMEGLDIIASVLEEMASESV